MAEVPVENIAEENSVLFLWATAPKLKEALGVMENWGRATKREQ
ncbi:MAG: hypothetical protein KAW92_10345 [Candidatus Cloacimonetes bacterium]|nr:hypothetical protein [Candidatus Cloacimonadota bacterium]